MKGGAEGRVSAPSHEDVAGSEDKELTVVYGPTGDGPKWHQVVSTEQRDDIMLLTTACGRSYVREDIQVRAEETTPGSVGGTDLCYRCVQSNEDEEEDR